MAIHSSVLVWRILGKGEPSGLPSMGSHKVWHDWSDLAATAAWWPTSPSRKTSKEDVLFIIGDIWWFRWFRYSPFDSRGLECKSRKSRDTWSNRQVWPWSTKWSRVKANRVFPREHTGIAKTLFQQYKRRLDTWTSADGQYRNEIDYIICSQRWRNSIQSAKTRLGADCGSDHELLTAKCRVKLKKVGKTTRPFRYDLN